MTDRNSDKHLFVDNGQSWRDDDNKYNSPTISVDGGGGDVVFCYTPYEAIEGCVSKASPLYSTSWENFPHTSRKPHLSSSGCDNYAAGGFKTHTQPNAEKNSQEPDSKRPKVSNRVLRLRKNPFHEKNYSFHGFFYLRNGCSTNTKWIFENSA